MRIIERASAFRRDYRRLVSGRYQSALNHELPMLLDMLVQDRKLDPQYHDHELVGNWRGYRECHVKSDLPMIYRFPDASTLYLARLGTHSELF